MNKLVQDGKVAVLFSPGFGAGWSTWNQEFPEIVFDPAVVQLVEKQQWQELETYVTLKYPGLYTGGMQDLKVAWLPEGTQFQIEEYDGSESISIKDDVAWITA